MAAATRWSEATSALAALAAGAFAITSALVGSAATAPEQLSLGEMSGENAKLEHLAVRGVGLGDPSVTLRPKAGREIAATRPYAT